MSLSRSTRDHDEIRRWAEARGARPAAVASTESEDTTGILRLEFPRAPNSKHNALEEIGWDEFFEKFDASGLEFLYQDQTADGEPSNFNKLVYPENDRSAGTGKGSHAASHGSASSKSHESSSKSHEGSAKGHDRSSHDRSSKSHESSSGSHASSSHHDTASSASHGGKKHSSSAEGREAALSDESGDRNRVKKPAVRATASAGAAKSSHRAASR